PNAYARLALVRTNKVAMSSLQLAFRNDDGDVRTAFQRTDKALETVGSDLKHTVMANFYPLTRSAGDLARRIRFDFYPRENPPASTLLLFEGLPSLDANLGLEIIAAIP
ncbi:MAG TPA: hypothetical protein VE621_21025, partial [Bryobacteraceae bacterium]|nr:hypothetical protein [Bryobacteraceae bacterium]